MEDFINWLSNTGLSLAIQNNDWAVPTIQAVHILAIAVLVSAVISVNLKLLRPASQGPVLSELVRRFRGWVWGSFLVLLVTGGLMITSEPHRELADPLFWIKMVVVVVVLFMTARFQRSVLTQPEAWNAPTGEARAKSFALVTFALWAVVIICGRWIAYWSVS